MTHTEYTTYHHSARPARTASRGKSCYGAGSVLTTTRQGVRMGVRCILLTLLWSKKLSVNPHQVTVDSMEGGRVVAWRHGLRQPTRAVEEGPDNSPQKSWCGLVICAGRRNERSEESNEQRNGDSRYLSEMIREGEEEKIFWLM